MTAKRTGIILSPLLDGVLMVFACPVDISMLPEVYVVLDSLVSCVGLLSSCSYLYYL